MFSITESIKKDITISEDGKVSCSRRGLAYLCGIEEKSIRSLLKTLSKGAEKSLSKSLQPYTGQAFQGA